MAAYHQRTILAMSSLLRDIVPCRAAISVSNTASHHLQTPLPRLRRTMLPRHLFAMTLLRRAITPAPCCRTRCDARSVPPSHTHSAIPRNTTPFRPACAQRRHAATRITAAAAIPRNTTRAARFLSYRHIRLPHFSAFPYMGLCCLSRLPPPTSPSLYAACHAYNIPCLLTTCRHMIAAFFSASRLPSYTPAYALYHCMLT